MTSQGEFVRCYSRRDGVDMSKGLRKTNLQLSLQDFERLPPVCRNCPFVPLCRGGCRCDWSLVETPFGSMDYLADPTRIAGAEPTNNVERKRIISRVCPLGVQSGYQPSRPLRDPMSAVTPIATGNGVAAK